MRFIAILSCAMIMASSASAFCGFYVAREDGALFNQGSTVVLARDGRQTTITMSSDYTGPASEFALIVPTPRVLEEQDIRAVDPADIQHLDDFTAPRLVEYFDRDPCPRDGTGGFSTEIVEPSVVIVEAEEPRPLFTPRDLGVRVEVEYAVLVYDIAILSARQSDGLKTYLRQEGYQIPDAAEEALAGYIDMRMKFFVAHLIPANTVVTVYA